MDAAQGISTRISAFDRASAIEMLANPNATPQELVQPAEGRAPGSARLPPEPRSRDLTGRLALIPGHISAESTPDA